MSAFSSSTTEYRQAIMRLYEKYDPTNVSRVDALLHRFLGREEALMKALERKFSERMMSEGEQTSTRLTGDCADAAQCELEACFSGPPPHAAPTAIISRKCDDAMLSMAAVQPISASSDLHAATVSEDVDCDNYRMQFIRLCETHSPLRVSPVDHELAKCKEQEEAYLHALEKKLIEVQPAEAAKDSVEEASLPATLPTVEVRLRDDHPKRTSDSAGYEMNTARLLRIDEAYAPDQAHHVECQLQRYAGREEEAIQAVVAKYGPEPVPLVAETELINPTVTIKSEETSTATENNADSLQIPSPSGPLTIAATPQRAKKTTEHAVDGVAASAEAEATLSAQAEAAATSTTTQKAKAVSVTVRATEHEGNGADGEAAPTQVPKLDAAVSASAVPPSSGGTQRASSPPAKSVVATGMTSNSLVLSAVAGSLQTASARKGKTSIRTSRLTKDVFPACKGEVARDLILDGNEVDASLSRAVRWTAPFNIAFYDFFRVLGSYHAHGGERVSLRVANTLLSALFPEMSPRKVLWEYGDMACTGEDGVGVSAEEMRERIVQGAARQLRNSASVSNLHVAQYTWLLVRRMESFVKTCRTAVLQLQRQPRSLFAGFWVHRAVLPRAVPQWKRCWATMGADGDAVLVCCVGSLKTEWHIPFARVARCYRENNATGAPRAYMRNGLAFQLTTGVPPLIVVVCPESSDVTLQLLSTFRSWSSSPRDIHGRCSGTHFASSPVPAPHSQHDGAESRKYREANQVRVWVLVRAMSTYELQRWCVEGVSIHMVSDRTREVHTCAVVDVEGAFAEMKLPVTPPARSAYGFVLCFHNGVTPLMAFTEQSQARTQLLDRLYRGQVLAQVEAKTMCRRGGGV
ncbi:hypothetical protein Q4I32_003418 [Leishmania shawi]|uniref:Uncharacterized protein n=1 Tax=Leishmania shawi TaxID=5680 RepID=A0AAW3BTJ2_9TRYP